MKSAVLLRRARVIIPLIILGLLAYIDYASCYIVVWKEVYHRHLTAAAIVFWVLLAILQCTHLLYWALIFIQGPGEIPHFKHFDLYGTKMENTAPVPDVFVCDEQGFPFWCSKCQNLKPDRSFHLTDLDTCVPRFDHFCLWIGTAIGRDNYLLFIKFLQLLSVYCILVLSYTAIYIRPTLRHNHSKILHFIALFILNSLILIFTVCLLIGAAKYISTNSTSFDEITRRQARSYKRWVEKKESMNPKYAWCMGRMPRAELGMRYINISHGNTRKVVLFYVTDHPYSNGFKVNLINTCLKGNYNLNSTQADAGLINLLKASIVAFVPFAELFIKTSDSGRDSGSFQDNSDEMSPLFIQQMIEKIERNQFLYALYLPQPLPGSKSES